MSKSENYLDDLLSEVDSMGHTDMDEPVKLEDDDLFLDEFEQELRNDDGSDDFLKQFEDELSDDKKKRVTKAVQPMLDDIDEIMDSIKSGLMEEEKEHPDDGADDADIMDMLNQNTDFSDFEDTPEEPQQKEPEKEVEKEPEKVDEPEEDLFGIEDGDPFGELDEPEKADAAENAEEQPEEESDKQDKKSKRKAKKEKKKKEKTDEDGKPKENFFVRLGKLLFGDDEDELDDEENIPTGEPIVQEISGDNLDILKELESEPKEEPKKKKEKKKKEKKPKKEKPEKKEKKPKPKKEKKPKPPAEPDNTPPLPKVPVILIFVMAASILLLIVMGTKLLGYSNSFANAEQLYGQGNYTEAFQAVAGVNTKEKDTDEYQKYCITAMVAGEYEAYESLMDAGVYDMALDALVRTVQRYDKYVEDANTYGCRNQLDDIESKAEEALNQSFGIGADQAREIYQTSDKKAYTKEIQKVLKDAGLSGEVTE